MPKAGASPDLCQARLDDPRTWCTSSVPPPWISVATSAIGGQEPGYAPLTRVVLTFGGAIAAVFLTVFLESFIRSGKAPADTVAL